MAYEWAKPGVKCVCIDTTPERNTGGPVNLEREEIYTIYSVNKHPLGPIGLIIKERESFSPWGFDISRFRPLHTVESDLEMFRLISEDSLGRLEAYEELLSEQFYVDESHG